MTSRVLYLRTMLQGLLSESSGQVLLRDPIGNTFSANQILNSGNNVLLNSLVWFNPDTKEISQVDQPGEYQPFPIGSWLQPSGGFYHNGPRVMLPPARGKIETKFLYYIAQNA